MLESIRFHHREYCQRSAG